MSERTPELEGRWEMIRGELAGEEAPELVVRKTELEFIAGNYVVRFDGEIVDRGTYEVGATLNVSTIILHGKAGSNAGRTLSGIYQLVGDRLRACFDLEGVMPAAFETQIGAQRYLATYRRKSKAL